MAEKDKRKKADNKVIINVFVGLIDLKPSQSRS
ncbi:MAG: hypothetical protein ACI9RU_000199 [Litorivivens sp.]|jgi:hypothetical protein